MLRVAIMANEPSGDLLGAGLMRELRALHPDIQFEGVGGPAMASVGLRSLYPLQALSVMGLVEVFLHLPELWQIRRNLLRYFKAFQPDVFIGIDAPDFNLSLASKLRSPDTVTVQYVCPSIWAWRENRAKVIRRAVDRVLCLLPFEPEVLRRHEIDGVFVGHPLADQLSEGGNKDQSKTLLGLDPDRAVLALLPGSRVSEIRALGELFARTSALCLARQPGLQLIAPMANDRLHQLYAKKLDADFPDLPVRLLDGHAREAMSAADVVLLASGTASLEALLLERPMVVAYRVNPITYRLVRALGLIRTRWFSLPNILSSSLLSNREIVPEYIQQQAQPERLAEAVLKWFDDSDARNRLVDAAREIRNQLACHASRRAAEAVLDLARSKSR